MDGWTYFSHTGYCYKHIDQAETWQGARKHCQNIGVQHGGTGELASEHDMQTVNFITGITFRGVTPGWSVWLGLYKPAGSPGLGGYAWSDGSPACFSNWNTDEKEPNGGNGHGVLWVGEFYHMVREGVSSCIVLS